MLHCLFIPSSSLATVQPKVLGCPSKLSLRTPPTTLQNMDSVHFSAASNPSESLAKRFNKAMEAYKTEFSKIPEDKKRLYEGERLELIAIPIDPKSGSYCFSPEGFSYNPPAYECEGPYYDYTIEKITYSREFSPLTVITPEGNRRCDGITREYGPDYFYQILIVAFKLALKVDKIKQGLPENLLQAMQTIADLVSDNELPGFDQNQWLGSIHIKGTGKPLEP